MPTIPIELVRPTAAQRVILDDPTRFRVVACGRRFGKTELAKQEIILRALRGQAIWYCAPTYKLARQTFREFIPVLRHIPGVYINRSENRIDMPTGGKIECVGLQEPDNLRGAGLDFIVMDEAAFVRDNVWDSVLRPMLATNEGDALFISSPYGRNWFWALFQRGLDTAHSQWAAHHYTSADGGLIRASELDDIRRSTPERVFAEEYMAEFHEDSGAVFRLAASDMTAPTDATPDGTHDYVMGVDWGRHLDYTVLTIIDRTTRSVVAVDRFNEIGWALQRGRLAALASEWNVSHIVAEANSMGETNIEELQRAGLPVRPFTTTNQSKKDVIEALALAIEQHDITLMPHDVMLAELQAYEIERLPSGNFRYNAPQGMHDDCVISLALAWHAVTSTVSFEGFITL